MGLIDDYFDLVNKYQNIYGPQTIILMQVGAFFEVYGKKNTSIHQITNFARICDLNIGDKNVCVGGYPVIMAGFKENFIDKYLNKIQQAGFTAVVYAQDEQSKNTTRSLAGIFSPGTFFSTDNQASLTNNTTCIWIEYIEHTRNILVGGLGKKVVEVGISNLDIYTGKTSIFQFCEPYIKNNPVIYDELERFISIYNPTEVIVITNLPREETQSILQYANIQTKAVHMVFIEDNESSKHIEMAKNCEKQVYLKEVLSRFYPHLDFHQRFNENNIATQSLCFLLDFVYQHNPFLVNRIMEPIFENVSNRLILANHSLKQLNIIDDNTFHGKFSSVEKMLNVCITAMGKRMFSHVFLNPTTVESVLNKEYAITDYLLGESQINSQLTTIFSRLQEIKDISKWTRQIILRKIAPKFFSQLFGNLQIILEMQNISFLDETLKTYLIQYKPAFSYVSEYCSNIMAYLNKNMDLSLAKDLDDVRDFDVNFIRRGVSPELDMLSQTLMESMDQWTAIQSYFNMLVGQAEKKTKPTEYVKQHETEKSQLSLIATKRRCALLKNALPASGTDGVTLKYISSFDQREKIFVFHCLKESATFSVQNASNNHISCAQMDVLCKMICTTKNEMKTCIGQIYLRILEQMELYQGDLDCIAEFVTTIDILYAKMTIAKKYHLCRPEIEDGAQKSFVNTMGLRHCLIENLQQSELYVANDLSLGIEDMDGILLYGTNAVGKTSLIRSLGIAVIMAQAGLYVPASKFRYKPYKSMFTRILGNDNIFKGLSTFAVEMSELRNILLMADENSLILGDELCSGTESISAVSIFVSGIQHLHKVQSSFIFATHLHEIVSYSEIEDLKRLSLKHMVVHYNREKDELVYDRKLRDGSGTNTYGLEVCKSLCLPQDFMENAHVLRMKYYPESASILSLKQSHYNSQKIMGLCERCGKTRGTEVHHLQHQAAANENGIIQSTDNSIAPFHQNRVANLMTLCESCHTAMHNDSQTGHKKVKTSKGVKIIKN